MAEQAVINADTPRPPRIAIGFFGVTRSLKWTLPSIQEHILRPARELGEVRLFAHLYQQTHIENPRSGENDPLDPEEYRLLECDEVRLEEPGHCLDEARYEWILSHGDAFHDGGKSLANLIHQLHSLQMVGQMIDGWRPDIVVLARPDLCYRDTIGKYITMHRSLGDNAVIVPNWQWYGGYNDRLAICGSQSYKVYTHRIDNIPVYLNKTGGPLPAERFLKFCLHLNGIQPVAAPIRAHRTRANGYTLLEDFRRPSLGKRLRRLIDAHLSRWTSRL